MPTLTWLDSFYHQQTAAVYYGTNAGIFDTGPTSASGLMSFVTGRRTGSFALQIAQNGSTASRAGKALPAGNRVLVESFYFKCSAKPSVDSSLWAATGAGANGSIQIASATGFLSIRAVSAGTPTAGNVDVTDGQWHRLDLKWVTSASPYTLDVSLDGVAQTQNTSGSTANDINSAGLGTVSAAHTLTAVYADWVRSFTGGDHPIGAHYCVPLIPNADGTHNWASTNMGDETGGRASSVTDLNTKVATWPATTAGTYVAYTNTTNTATEYAEILLPDVPSAATVWAARAIAALFSSGTTANAATTRIVDGSGTTVLDLYVGDQSDTSLRHQAALLPGVDTPSEVNALKWRVGFPTDSNPAPRWPALMVDIALPGDNGDGTATPSAVAGIGAVPAATAKGDGTALPSATAGVGAVPVLALLLAEQSGTGGANTPINGTGGVSESATQEFVLQTSAQVKQIDIRLTKQGSPTDDIHITLWTGDPNDAHSLGTLSTVTASTVGVAQWVSFPFNISMSGGTRYFMRVSRDDTFDSTNRVIWSRTLSDPLPDLDRWTLDSGTWSRLTDADQAFRVYGSPLVVASAIASAQGCRGIGAVPAATASGVTPAAPAVVAGVGAVPAPTAKGNSTASPAVTAGVGAVPAATGKGNGTASPAAVAGVGAVPASTAKGNGTAFGPATVAGIGAVPRAHVGLLLAQSLGGGTSIAINGDGGGNERAAQEFTPTGDWYVTEIAVFLTREGTGAPISMVIYQGSPASPVGGANGPFVPEIPVGSISTSGEWVFFATDELPGLTLSSGTLYHIQLFRDDGIRDTTNRNLWDRSATNQLSELRWTMDSGVWTSNAVTDFRFQIYGGVLAGGAAASPSTVVGAGAVPAPTAKGNGTATPAATAGVGAVPAPTATGGGAPTALPAQVAGVGAVPAPTAKGDGSTSVLATAPGISNTGEGGNSGATVSTTNSDDDGQGTAWDAVAIGAGSTITYDDHGAIGKSIKIAKAASETNTLDWNATLPNGTTQYGRMYLLFDVAPTSQSQILLNYRNNADTSAVGSIRLTTGAKLVLGNSSGTTVATSSMTFATGTLYRLEWKFVADTTVGSWDLRIYAGHSTTPLETLNPTAINTSTTAGIVRIGTNGTQTGVLTYWAKWFNTNQTAFPGPAIVGTTQVVGIGAVPAATATGAVNGTATPAVVAGIGAVPAPTLTATATATPAATAGVGAVPAPTAKGDGSTAVNSATAPGISNTAEGGVQGNNVDVTNSDDDGQGTAWDAVTPGASSTVTYDDHGAIGKSIKVAKATTETNLLEWDATLVDGNTQYGRMYVLWDAWPATVSQVIVQYRTAGGTNQGRIQIGASQTIMVTDASGTVQGTSTVTLSLGALYRLEWQYVRNATTGSWELRIYAGHSTTPLETLNPTGINTGGATTGVIRYGVLLGAVNAFTIWQKWFNANQTAFPGPVAQGTTTVQGVGAVPAATAISASNGTATPPAVAGIGAVPAPAASGATVASPAAVAGIGSLPTPTASGTSAAQPAQVVGIGAVPAPTAKGNGTAAPVQTVGIGLVPAATGSVFVTAAPAVVAGIGAVPAPQATGAATATPAATSGVGAVPAPSASGATSSSASPATVAGTGSVPAPTVIGAATATPGVVAGTGNVQSPTSFANPATVAGIGAVPPATARGAAFAAPATVVAVGAVPAPTAKGNATALPAATAGTGSVPSATAKGDATALPAATAGVGSVPAPTGSVFVTASPAATVGVGSVPAPTATGAAKGVAAAVVGVGAVPPPTAKGNATASPAVTVGVGSVPAPTASGTVSATATPARVAGVGSIPTPAVTGTASAHPQGRVDPFTGEFSEEFGELQDAPTQALGRVPAPTTTGTSVATPDVVAGTGVVPDSIAHGNATAFPVGVAGVGSVPPATAPSGATALPAVTAGVGSVPPATATGAAFASPPAVVGVGSVPPVVASGLAFAHPSVTAGIGSVPVATANGGAAAIGLPGSVAGVGTVPAPVGSGSATASPTPVAGVGAVPAPTVTGATTAQPAATAGVGAVPPSTAKGNATAAPAVTAGVGAVPPVTAFALATALPAATAGVGSVPAPVVSGAAFASPGAVPGIGGVPVTTAAGGSVGTATPARVAGIGSVPAPVATGLATAAPIATAGTGAVPPATATGRSTAQPAATAGVGSVPAPTVTGTAIALPVSTAGVGSVPPSTAVATAKATPAVSAGVGSVPAPTVTGGASSTASPAATAGVGAVPAASASGLAFAKPVATAGVGSVPSATAHGAATATSTQVAGVGSVPQSSPDSQARALPAAVAGVGLVPSAIGRGTATASPATVAAVGSVPAASAFGGVASTATPVSVVGIGSVPAPVATVTIRAFPPRVAGFGAVPASTQTGAGRALPIAAFAIGLVPTPEVIGANANTATPTVVEGIGAVPAPNAHGQGPAEPQHDYSPGHHPSPIVGTPGRGWSGSPTGRELVGSGTRARASGSANARYTGKATPEGGG